MPDKTAIRATGMPGLLLVSLLLAMGMNGCAVPGKLPPGPPVSTALGQRTQIQIDSAPTGALISMNGRLLGQAPLVVTVELDDLGDAAEDLSFTADFADSFGRQNAAQAPVVSHSIARGDRVTTSITFDPEGASAR